MWQKMLQVGSGGGSETLFDLLMEKEFLNGGSGSTDQTFTAEIGKKYLIVSIRTAADKYTASDCGISSGATLDKVFVNNQKNTTIKPGEKMYICIATATDTTIAMLGTNNICVYMPID